MTYLKRLLRLLCFTILIVFLSCTVWPTPLIAQAPSDTLFIQAVRQVWSGNPYALRDIGSYLGDSLLDEQARLYLQAHTLFTKEEFDWEAQPSRQAFLDFFYKNKSQIYFDRSISLYLITPVEALPFSDFLVRAQEVKRPAPKAYFQSLTTAITSTEKLEVYEKALKQLSRLHTPESWDKILDFAEKAALKQSHFDPYPSLAQALRFCPDLRALSFLQKWIKTDKITASDAEIPLSEMLNTFIPTVTKEYLLALIKMRLKGHSSIAAMKRIGYESINSMQPTFFMDTIDYYGHIVGITGSKPWARNNALEVLVAARHPRSLYYLATLMWERRNYLSLYQNPTDALQPALSLIEDLTQASVHVQNYKGVMTASDIDVTWVLNYLKYWASHYDEYVWDEMRGHFINKLRAETVREHAQNLFSNLNSSKDSIALDAFKSLTELSPELVAPLAEEYRAFGQRINPILPSMRLPILEQMTAFTAACKAFEVRWNSDSKIDKAIQLLRQKQTPQERQGIEQNLINTMPLEAISSLEYAALLYGQNPDFSLSMSRILDHLYAQYWRKILENYAELRFFLKKSAILERIGTHGTCNAYRTFFEKNKNASQKTLQQLIEKETDNDVRYAAQSALELLKANEKILPRKPTETTLSEAEFLKKLNEINKAESLHHKALNLLLESVHFDTAKHLKTVLSALPKLDKSSAVLRLDYPTKLSAAAHLKYFEPIDFDTRSLGQFTRLFDGQNPALFFDFYLEKTQKTTFEERGHILTQAFSVHWMIAYLMQIQAENTATKAIQRALQSFSDESEYLSEYEENQLRFLLLLFETIGSPFAQKLEAAFQKGVSYRTEQKLLAYATWADLPSLAPYIEYLKPSPEGQPGYMFLNRDFGFPPLAFDDAAVYAAFFPKKPPYQSPAQVYRKALLEFGLLSASKDELEQLYVILKRERISPYIGGGGFFRDWGVFAAVKLLEDRFAENFGFHEKLNENQTFYIYNSSTRSKQWMEYLEKNGLVNKTTAPITWQ